MVATPSTMLELGTKVPDFSLRNAVDDHTVTPADFDDRDGLLVMFICNHCPYVKHVLSEITAIASEYQPKGVGVVAINANDIEAYPQDGPEHMKQLAGSEGWTFPFLLDEDQEVAKKFRAACTPDFYLFDGDHRLVYRGQLDDSRPDSGIPLTGNDLRAALDALLAGKPPLEEQKPSLGCNIKWKKGNEPEYFG
ncbi:MAG: thioredoxin family protein [Gemmatimonadales bacterium]|jgi:peroxiredoxin